MTIINMVLLVNWQILISPLIGALIGYITNKIAVEMLFRPLKPLYIGKLHVPFTPGIIPKEKDRFGKAIGNAVGDSLLTAESIKETLLSEKLQSEIEESIETIFANLNLDQSTVRLKLEKALGEDSTLLLENSIKHTVSNRINNGLIGMNLGEVIAKEVLVAVNEKVQGTMLAMMLDSSIVTQLIEDIEIRINKYIQLNGEERISAFIDEEILTFMEQSTSALIEDWDITELKNMVLNIYSTIVNNYTEQILDTLNLSGIVEEKINAMDILEVEKLVLSIMEKELGAVVNLGALIGFILGTLNLIF